MKKALYIILFALPLLLLTCQKHPKLKIYNLEINDETVEAATTTAEITVKYSYPTKLEYVNTYLSINGDVSNATVIQASINDDSFTVKFSNLLENTRYFYRFEYSNGVNVIKTEIKNFTTQGYTLPVVSTSDVTDITSNSAICGGEVTSSGYGTISARGLCWSKTQNPSISDNVLVCGDSLGVFSATITNLEINTIYYVRAYATNEKGTGYGNEISFSTTASLATVTTKTVTNITEASARSGGDVTDSGGIDITSRGVCWSTEHNPTTNDSHTTDGNGLGEFNSDITGLTANVTYYVRAYATNSYGTSYGNEVEFTTQVGMPIVTTKSVTGIIASSAQCGGEVISNGGGTVTARGVCWSTSQNPTITNNHTTDGTGNGEFTSSITGLSNNTIYYVRAYATNSHGTSYGEERSFTTQEGLAVVTTNDVTNINATSATCGGNISDDGGFSIIARGVCWSASQNPTTSDSHTTDGSGTGSFNSTITGLTYNTIYYVRAYATNSKGTSYGEEKLFTTSKLAPTVTTNDVSSITTTTAICGGNVTSDGGASVTARGVCWSTSQNPTTSGNHTTDGNGTGTFTSSITGLTENTTYYVRAYATNSEGTSYGTQKTFTTPHAVTLPTVITNNISDITSSTAVSGGNVTFEGYGTVSAKGVCWSSSQNPSISDLHTIDGTGAGAYTSYLTGLTSNTTYYVRAYATNESGMAYGEQKIFTTEQDIALPTVTTNNVSNITISTAYCGGNVTDDGNSTVTAKGVCWSTSQNPTISNSHTSDGSGTGTFISQITGLNASTTYCVRAYATNGAGTAYGNQVSFSTPQVPTGAIGGLYTVCAGRQVYFSKGNLQYQASTNTWRFAENQWNYVGGFDSDSGVFNGNVSGSSNNDISSTYSGWIDLFGWGTSGYNHGAICYQPWSTNNNFSDYYAYGEIGWNLYNQTGQAEWGYNSISNGGNQENSGWRTLTKDEWVYVFNSRETPSGIRYVKGIVNGVNGVILLPDSWDSSLYVLNYTNNAQAAYSSNIISAIDWSDILEVNGAVFLPPCGKRHFGYGEQGFYWSSQYANTQSAYILHYHSEYYLNPDSYNYRCEGHAVRLVKEYNY
ncbi:MAG: hypothetical protein IJK92_02175 [Bacteroidales bacterium]|nr:hypothetical protein [Bacteroidales bacterium]